MLFLKKNVQVKKISTRKKIAPFSLFFLIIASIDSIRNLPAVAVFGPKMVFFFILGAVIFLIPVALVCAQHAAASTKEGGLYHWVRKAFGEKWGMTAAWLHWVNTVIWYPSFLSFIAATAAYLYDPALAENKNFLICGILVAFWGITFLSLYGIHVSIEANDVFVVLGTVFPMLLLIALTIHWLSTGGESQVTITYETVRPSFSVGSSWVALIAVMASFIGVELAGVHVKEVERPKRHFHRAFFAASAFILFTMLFGSLSIAAILPQQEIHLVSGIMQTFSILFASYGLEALFPLLTLLVLLGTLGSLINWLVSPAKGLLEAADHGYIPRFLFKQNRHGAPYWMMIVQALIVSLFCFLLYLVPTINAFYWFLISLSTSMYMFVYILILLSALVLRCRGEMPSDTFSVPGKKAGLWVTVLLGLVGCCLTIIMSFFPPEEIDIGSPWIYTAKIAIGTLSILLMTNFFFWHKKVKG